MKKKEKKEKKQKEKFVDDGRVIASMDAEHINGYRSAEERKKHEEIKSLDLNKDERKAIYKAALRQYVPMILCFVGMMVLLLLLFYFFV
ncbi:MAG: hypothetical protein IJY62_03840 [Clostridia bacterium]|nr:hypothetical protein [Clostridia bacterium]